MVVRERTTDSPVVSHMFHSRTGLRFPRDSPHWHAPIYRLRMRQCSFRKCGEISNGWHNSCEISAASSRVEPDCLSTLPSPRYLQYQRPQQTQLSGVYRSAETGRHFSRIQGLCSSKVDVAPSRCGFCWRHSSSKWKLPAQEFSHGTRVPAHGKDHTFYRRSMCGPVAKDGLLDRGF